MTGRSAFRKVMIWVLGGTGDRRRYAQTGKSTVGKPAYFHGGRGEEVFRGQLNQTLAEHMSKATADRFADPLFHRQFPHLPVESK